MLFVFLFFGLTNCKPLVSAYFAFFDDAYNSTMNVSKTIPWSMFDRIIVSFAILEKNANLTNQRTTDHSKILHIISLYKKARPNGEIFVSLYGEINTPFLYAANHSAIFSRSVLQYLKRYNINGIDLDWETVFINKYATSLVTLIKSCDQIFNNKYKITHAIWPYVHDPQTIGQLTNIVDEINIMSYGLGIKAIESLINQYHLEGFPYEKMILGMETESDTETKETIAGKIGLINKYNLSGIFVWRLDNDGIPVENNTNSGPPTFRTTKMLYDVLHSL